MDRTIKCPDCRQGIRKDSLKDHVLNCKKYSAKLFQSTIKISQHLNDQYLQFLVAEMDLAKQTIQKQLNRNSQKKSQTNNQIQDFEELFSQNKNKIQKQAQKEDRSKYHKQLQTKESINNHKAVQNYQIYDPTIRLDYLEEQVFPVQEQMIQDKIFKKQSLKKQQSFNSKQNAETKIQCENCKKKINLSDIAKYVYIEPCCHLLCLQCIKSYIEDQYIAYGADLMCLIRGCKEKMNNYQIKQIVGSTKFQQMENQLVSKMMGSADFVKCKKCGNQYQFTQGNIHDAPKKDSQGKKISRNSGQHFIKNRFLCPNNKCKQEQCKNCKQIPYHLGKSCEQYQQFKNAKKCRYCRQILKKGYTSNKGIRAFDDICPKKECEKIAKKACSKVHKCKHPCYGYINQKQCLPCLKQQCAKEVIKHDQNQDSYCTICYVQDLRSGPCVKSKCGHIYHYTCLEKRLQIRWLTPRIIFSFCECPICKEWIQVPQDCKIHPKLKQFLSLKNTLEQKALKRLKNQKLQNDPKIIQQKSEYYKKPLQYAMAIYAYFQCFKCKKPYFGGRKSCAERMDSMERNNSQDFDPTKLVCPQCCPVSTKNCDIHGKQFISYKCKFCCNIAQWFCWGSTHFCDKCHIRQTKGQYLSKLSKDKLPQCQGAQKCPIGGDHPLNGEQYNLGCMLCRQRKKQKSDF